MNSKAIVQAYINLFNARRAVDGEPPIPPSEIPLYEKVLTAAPSGVLDAAGWKAEQYAKAEVQKMKK